MTINITTSSRPIVDHVLYQWSPDLFTVEHTGSYYDGKALFFHLLSYLTYKLAEQGADYLSIANCINLMDEGWRLGFGADMLNHYTAKGLHWGLYPMHPLIGEEMTLQPNEWWADHS